MELASFFNELALASLVILGLLFFISSVDDLVLDILRAFLPNIPTEMDTELATSQKTERERKIAILIPAWKEAGIIARMLLGNLQQIDYQNYILFVGAYPNDPDTLNEVKEVIRTQSRVQLIVNTRIGPTTKGQMINEMVSQIYARNDESIEAILFQDAEDLIHPDQLCLMNVALKSHDFIQVPVFSALREYRQFTAGSYMDEFAESHTKAMIVRDAWGAAIPSAGVGTALRWDLVETFLRTQGSLLNSASLTEDYELGIRAKLLGASPQFLCVRKTPRDWVATREFFPSSFWASVRQKSRWLYGVAIQGCQNLGWQGSWIDRYFLLRDRKGVITQPAMLFGYLAGAYAFLFSLMDRSSFESWRAIPFIELLWIGNLSFAFLRLLSKLQATAEVYGWKAATGVIARWPVTILINGLASLSAWSKAVEESEVHWGKTQHELPQGFGEVAIATVGAKAQ